MKMRWIALLVMAVWLMWDGIWQTAAQEATAVPTLTPVTVTPRADGSIVHIVGPTDTFWSIAIQYAPVLGMTPEEALPYIQELNGNPAFVVAGQELLIREATSAVTPTGEAETPTPETTSEGETTATPEGEVVVVEGQPLDATPTLEATATGQTTQATAACVSAFEDKNGNGQFDADTDVVKTEVAITLFKDGQTISTYITNATEEEHCFEDLEAGAYQVQMFLPANYVATTADSWTVTANEGEVTSVAFGLQPQETAVAETGSTGAGGGGGGETAVTPEAASETTAETTTEASDGPFSNVGTIVVIVAIILILLAGAGVVMLRRG
jgi:hypothetical protein